MGELAKGRWRGGFGEGKDGRRRVRISEGGLHHTAYFSTIVNMWSQPLHGVTNKQMKDMTRGCGGVRF